MVLDLGSTGVGQNLMKTLVIRNVGVLCTMDGPAANPLGRLERAALVAEDDLVTWLGPESHDLPLRFSFSPR